MEIKNSSAVGDVIATGNNVGGLVGRVSSTSAVKIIESFHSSGDVSSSGGDNVGGLIGLMENTGAYEIAHNFSSADSVGASGANVHGFIGSDSASSASVLENYWDLSKAAGTDSATEYEGLSTAQMRDIINFTGWDNVNTWHFTGDQYPSLIRLP